MIFTGSIYAQDDELFSHRGTDRQPSGPAGKSVQIDAANYGVDPIKVTFGNLPAVDATFASGKFTVNVPSSLSAGNVNVVVTVKGISSDPASFTVTAQ